MEKAEHEATTSEVSDEQLEAAAVTSSKSVEPADVSDAALEAAAGIEWGFNTAVPCSTRGVPTCS